ncbi:MAG: nicotinamide mononucleotide adenylyltransferase [Rickettsiales bacterium]|jgi:nicotinamide mononucleotide adenylyltransferase
MKNKFVILIGRRQPFHLGHFDCVKNVLKAGGIPLIFIGSSNDISNKNYNPLDNPLNLNQSIEQLEFIMRDRLGLVKNQYKIISISDFNSSESWSKKLVSLLNENFPNEKMDRFLFHFFPKPEENKKITPDSFEVIKNLSAYVSKFQAHGIEPIIFDGTAQNRNLSSTKYRQIDLRTSNEVDLDNVPYLTRIIELAENARRNSNFSEVFVANQIPLTMLDLTLDRLKNELDIDLDNILKTTKEDLFYGKRRFCFGELFSATEDFLKKR